MSEGKSMKKPTTGFIGLGVMGSPMARNLAKAGYALVVYDIKAIMAERIADEFEQVRAAESPKMVAGSSDIVITMLPTGKHVQDVIKGRDGLIEGYRPGSRAAHVPQQALGLRREILINETGNAAHAGNSQLHLGPGGNVGAGPEIQQAGRFHAEEGQRQGGIGVNAGELETVAAGVGHTEN